MRLRDCFFCGDSQTPCAYVNSHKGNFSPRVGVNWDPAAKGTKPSGGYGLFYDNPEEYYFDRFADNSPFGSATTLSRPAGGFTNPYQGLTVPAFPLRSLNPARRLLFFRRPVSISACRSTFVQLMCSSGT